MSAQDVRDEVSTTLRTVNHDMDNVTFARALYMILDRVSFTDVLHFAADQAWADGLKGRATNLRSAAHLVEQRTRRSSEG
jgi:hypothetical protein